MDAVTRIIIRVAALEDNARKYEVDAQLYTARANEAIDAKAREVGLRRAHAATMAELRIRSEIAGLDYALTMLSAEVAR